MPAGQHRHHHLMPFLAVAAGIASFSVMDGLMKAVSLAIGAYSAMLWRSAAGVVLMAPIWKLRGGTMPSGSLLRLHALRGANTAGMAVCFFYGITKLPLAEGIAISFIAPLMALYLAAIMLGETISRKAILASLLGLGGVVVICAARLGEGSYDREAVLGIAAILVSAALYAWNLILQRQQAQVAGPVEVALFQNLFVGLFLVPAAPWLLRWVEAPALGLIAGAAALAIVSLMLLTWAYARAEAQVLLPVEYTGFAWAALYGWLWFGEAVTLTTLAGVALIVAACWITARPGAGRAVQPPLT